MTAREIHSDKGQFIASQEASLQVEVYSKVCYSSGTIKVPGLSLSRALGPVDGVGSPR